MRGDADIFFEQAEDRPVADPAALREIFYGIMLAVFRIHDLQQFHDRFRDLFQLVLVFIDAVGQEQQYFVTGQRIEPRLRKLFFLQQCKWLNLLLK